VGGAGSGNREPRRKRRGHMLDMALLSRAARLATVLVASASSAASCAADPGDAPKGDASSAGTVGDDGPALDHEVDPFEASLDGALPFVDGGSVEASGEPGPQLDAPGTDVSTVSDATIPPDASSVDAPPDVTQCATCPLVVEYTTPTTTPSSQEIRPHLDILNNGASPQDLASLTVRYWYTSDGSASQAYACDYAALSGGCSALSAQFVAMPQAKTNADHYMEVSFSSGTIAPGGQTGDLQLRFHDTNYAVTFTQTNDWSFDASKTAYAAWTNVTLYRSGALVWGAEPP